MVIAIVSIMFATRCGGNSDKDKIADAMCKYVQPRLSENETFGFVGLSNRRDTLFMGETHPCVGVIYTVTGPESDTDERHYADVILSTDYSEILFARELDFDPIEMAEEKIKEKFMEKLHEKMNR